MSHPSLAAVAPVSTFFIEVLPWAASGAIGLYLLWATCIAPEPAQTLTPAGKGAPAVSSLTPAVEDSAEARHTWGIAARPDLASADQSAANSM